jgi:hypothetical protein
MPNRKRILTTALCLLMILTIRNALAQSATATLSGTVVDEKGAVVAGAKIELTNLGTVLKRAATTTDEGFFTFPLLPPGSYTLQALRDGFAPLEVRNIVLNVGDQQALIVRLRVGGVAATVNVTDEASLVSESPAVGTVIDRQFVEHLPLSGRAFNGLIELSPGVVVARTSNAAPGQFSVNGQRTNANYFMVDGVSANAGINAGASVEPGQAGAGSLPALTVFGGTNSLVSVDALQEFRIETSTYAAEFGRQPGAQISMVTRSGTNEYRGTLFEYLRHDALDANDWFANSRGLAKPELRQHDFGGVFGGPVRLPKPIFGPLGFDGRDRTFFFFSYEGLRLKQPQVRVTEVPSMATRAAAPARLRPMFDMYPVPNGADLGGGLAEFSSSFSNPNRLDAASLRLDHRLAPAVTLFGRYHHAPSSQEQRGAFNYYALSTVGHVRLKTQTVTLGATTVLGPRVSNELRANWSRSTADSLVTGDDYGGAKRPPDSFLFPPFTSSDKAVASVLLGGTADYFIGTNTANEQRQLNLVNNLSLVAGSHQLKFGADYRRLSPVTGTRAYSALANFFGIQQALTGVAPFASIVGSSARDLRMRFGNFSAYAQDTWRAGQRLTLSYGLRWEYNPPPSEKEGRNPATVLGIDDPPNARLAPPGTRLYNATLDNFAPRFGAAYQARRQTGRELVLRGGFGLFYDLGSSTAANGVIGFPYQQTKFVNNVQYPFDLATATPPPATLNPPYGQIYAFEPNIKLPRVYQWNFAAEQSLGVNQSVSVSYVAAVGRRLLLRRPLLNLNPAFARGIFLTRSAGTSDYHALQAQFQRRMSRGLQALASYTWGKSLDTGSTDVYSLSSALALNANRGPSDFDLRHTFTAAATYDLPAPSGSALSPVLRDWSLDVFFRARSAPPVEVDSVRRLATYGNMRLRPDLVPGAPLYLKDASLPGGKRFNRAAFAIPAEPRQGTLGRNVLRGFGAAQLDLALRRQFSLTERVKLQLRAELFNALNQPSFGAPEGFLPSGLFGLSTQMLGRSLGSGGADGGFSPLYQVGGPRSMQLAARLSF